VPEGHTIHRIARDQGRVLTRRRLDVTSPQGRFAAGAALIDRERLERIEAYGKHLFYGFAGGHVLHVHLGLFGVFGLHKGAGPLDPVGAVRLRMVAGRHDGRPPATVDLRGPTACAVLTPDERMAIVGRLGPDPLRSDADPERFSAAVARTARAIGAVLLDQSVIAGIGNVYRAEILFACRIDPRRSGRDLSGVEVRCVWDTASAMLHKGVKDGRIVTIDGGDVGPAPARRPRRGEATYAYHRDVCVRCGSAIERYELGARTCWSCPVCQS
jgi:endonuclease-8